MAILKMKRLRLMLVRSRKEELLRELAKLGCVEFAELESVLEEDGLSDQVRRESSELMALRSKQAALEHAVELLDQYAPVKKPLLSAKPEFSDETLLDSTGIEAALEKAAELAALDERVRRITAEELRLHGSIESLTPWKDLDLPLEQDDGIQKISSRLLQRCLCFLIRYVCFLSETFHFFDHFHGHTSECCTVLFALLS